MFLTLLGLLLHMAPAISQEIHHLDKSLTFLEDPSHKLTLQKILNSPKNSLFAPVFQKKQSASPFWFKLTLNNSKKMILQINKTNIDYISFFSQ